MGCSLHVVPLQNIPSHIAPVMKSCIINGFWGMGKSILGIPVAPFRAHLRHWEIDFRNSSGPISGSPEAWGNRFWEFQWPHFGFTWGMGKSILGIQVARFRGISLMLCLENCYIDANPQKTFVCALLVRSRQVRERWREFCCFLPLFCFSFVAPHHLEKTLRWKNDGKSRCACVLEHIFLRSVLELVVQVSHELQNDSVVDMASGSVFVLLYEHTSLGFSQHAVSPSSRWRNIGRRSTWHRNHIAMWSNGDRHQINKKFKWWRNGVGEKSIRRTKWKPSEIAQPPPLQLLCLIFLAPFVCIRAGEPFMFR